MIDGVTGANIDWMVEWDSGPNIYVLFYIMVLGRDQHDGNVLRADGKSLP